MMTGERNGFGPREKEREKENENGLKTIHLSISLDR